jgi:uncharacterized protein (TIGR00266 family)
VNVKVDVKGGNSFSFLKVALAPGEKITTEAGAMASMDKPIELRSKFNGGFLKAFLLKFLGKETFFRNTFSNPTDKEQTLFLTQNTPGQVVEQDLKNEELYIQPGAFIACTEGVDFQISWAGFYSWIAREGLFRLRISGTGKVWYGAFGAVMEKEINGKYLIDTGHLLSYPPNLKFKLQLVGGLFSSFFSGEGFVVRLEGQGKIKIQTRSLGGFASWLNSKF